MTSQLLITALVIGIAAGMLSGLVGVGGGVIMVPALVFFMKYTQHQAQGTSLAVLTLPVTIVAAIYYYYQGQKTGAPIDLKIVGVLGVGFLIGGFFGSKIALAIDQATLKKIFVVILLYTAIKMLGWDAALVRWLRGLF